ncbi:hypothetical protein Poli38472_006673 [Pythium oligandrum]|uniref:Uncharacterized protein n=1 Tax=Pythium oligandrum TaxID=41045 RepID=A0A8K1C5H2_PYTOL|nr:hypothetical protein Poli38472_006673 [Pythium oligandrum]|eukprot:TMW56663.1 hypothetical protein Poli38472_006673 [Pythium oligandrum]
MMKCVIGLLMLAASVNAQSLTACNADKLKSSMTACDSLPNVSQVKCDDKACHSALHYLTEDAAAKCWVELGLGKADDLNKYKELDEFCHGEGHDPAEEGEGHDHEHEHEHEHEHDHSGSGHHHHDAGSNSTSDVTAPATGDASVPTPAPSAAVSTFALSSAALVASAAVIASL